MKRNALLLAGAVSAAALATSLALANVALAQEAPVTQSVAEPKPQEEAAKASTDKSEQTVRQIVIEPKAAEDDKPKSEIATKPETKALATEETEAAAAAEQTKEAKADAVAEKTAESENKADKSADQAVVAEDQPKAETTATDTKTDPEDAAKTEEASAKTEKVDETAAADIAEANKSVDSAEDVVSKETTAVPLKRSREEIVLALQTELKRVGCYGGAIDGVWGEYSEEALEAFRYFGQIDHDDATPSEAWVAHVKGATKTICHAHQYGDAYPHQYQGYDKGYHAPSYDGYRGSYPGGSTYRY